MNITNIDVEAFFSYILIILFYFNQYVIIQCHILMILEFYQSQFHQEYIIVQVSQHADQYGYEAFFCIINNDNILAIEIK